MSTLQNYCTRGSHQQYLFYKLYRPCMLPLDEMLTGKHLSRQLKVCSWILNFHHYSVFHWSFDLEKPSKTTTKKLSNKFCNTPNRNTLQRYWLYHRLTFIPKFLKMFILRATLSHPALVSPFGNPEHIFCQHKLSFCTVYNHKYPGYVRDAKRKLIDTMDQDFY